MLKFLKAPILAVALMSAGFAVAKLDVLDWPASAQQVAPGGPAPGAREAVPAQAGQALRSTAGESAADLAPVLERVAKRVEAMETLLTRLIEEARAKAIGYAVWLAAGLSALMFISSVLGGTVAALVLRRSRAV
jgi:hypothetical protein